MIAMAKKPKKQKLDPVTDADAELPQDVRTQNVRVSREVAEMVAMIVRFRRRNRELEGRPTGDITADRVLSPLLVRALAAEYAEAIRAEREELDLKLRQLEGD